MKVKETVRCEKCKFSTESGGYDSEEEMRTCVNCLRKPNPDGGFTRVPKDGSCEYGEAGDTDWSILQNYRAE